MTVGFSRKPDIDCLCSSINRLPQNLEVLIATNTAAESKVIRRWQQVETLAALALFDGKKEALLAQLDRNPLDAAGKANIKLRIDVFYDEFQTVYRQQLQPSPLAPTSRTPR